MRLVRVVTRARSPALDADAGSPPIRSSIWPAVGRTSITGSSRPVGRISCSTMLLRPLQLVGAGSGRDEDGLAMCPSNSSKVSGRLSRRRGQAEAVLHQGLLARAVAGEHPPRLGHRHVRLVDEHQEVVREVIQQRPGGLARARARRGAGSSSRSPAVPVSRSISMSYRVRCCKPLGLQQLVLLLEPLDPLLQLLLDGHHRSLQLLLRGDEVAWRGRYPRCPSPPGSRRSGGRSRRCARSRRPKNSTRMAMSS